MASWLLFSFALLVWPGRLDKTDSGFIVKPLWWVLIGSLLLELAKRADPKIEND